MRNGPYWRRLEHLSRKAHGRRGAALAPAEVDELVRLYQRTAAQLSHARTYYDDPGLTAGLTTSVARAGAAVYGTGPGSRRAVRRFFAETFPAAVWVSGRFIAVAAALLLVPAVVVGAWMATSPAALDVAVPAEEQAAILESRFEDYYSSAPAGEFSTKVLVNNIQVSFLAFALGALACVGTAAVLVFNGANIGVVGGLFVDAGQGAKFFGLVLPHGLLELTAIVLAGAAGLRLGWAVIAPGDRPRSEALAREGRRSVVIILGLMVCFVVAGIVEGFVTPSDLPTLARVGVGAVVELAFLGWVMGRGRDAASRGLTGLFGEEATGPAVGT